VKLTLKYPEGDPAVAKACQQIANELKSLGASSKGREAEGPAGAASSGPAIDIELASCSPAQLRRDVEVTHEYDLAYYHWDFPDETYWLWPLFDPQAIGSGGKNFLGYKDDEVLESLFRKAMTHRDFTIVQDLTQRIHDRLYEQMPLVPLWQLDTHVASRKSLIIPEPLDPLLIFTNVERWSLSSN
jgi:ABC-type transport system substrate-binding protein